MITVRMRDVGQGCVLGLPDCSNFVCMHTIKCDFKPTHQQSNDETAGREMFMFFSVPAPPKSLNIPTFDHLLFHLNKMYIYTTCYCVNVMCSAWHVSEMWTQDLSGLRIHRPEKVTLPCPGLKNMYFSRESTFEVCRRWSLIHTAHRLGYGFSLSLIGPCLTCTTQPWTWPWCPSLYRTT